jgi:glycosyltransferase involved in cell wall biosynthesis
VSAAASLGPAAAVRRHDGTGRPFATVPASERDAQRQCLRVRVIDLVASPGGGRRFLTEALRALAATRPDAQIELLTAGNAFAALHARLADLAPSVRLRRLRTARSFARPLLHVLRVPALRAAAAWFDLGWLWHATFPYALVAGPGVVWLPWLHRHRLPARVGAPVVGSFHDDTFLEFAPRAVGHPHALFVADEMLTTRAWLASPARLVVSSQTTRERAAGRFGVAESRFDVVPLAGTHLVAPAWSAAERWAWAGQPYLLCPANFGHHKNHEVLLRGVAAWGARWPLVLTGPGAALPSALTTGVRRLARAVCVDVEPRAQALLRLALSLGLRPGVSLHALGMLAEDEYAALVAGAAAVVVPTLAEGGGSFPVWEALHLGVPVLCSDIPVLREQAARSRAEVVFFDPTSPESLAQALRELAANRDRYALEFRDQALRLQRRSWTDVASEYWNIFDQECARGNRRSCDSLSSGRA